jgi:hypothetical protein
MALCAVFLVLLVLLVVSAEDCLSDWEKFGTKCYKFPSSVYFYDQCDSYCSSQDATMMCIESEDESVFIQRHMYKRMHIGLRRRAGDNQPTWFANCTSTYQHWKPGEPNGGSGVNGEFVQMYSSTGEWMDYRDDQIYCGCEYNLPEQPPTDDGPHDDGGSGGDSSVSCNQTCVLIVIIVAVAIGVGILTLMAALMVRFYFCGKIKLKATYLKPLCWTLTRIITIFTYDSPPQALLAVGHR